MPAFKLKVARTFILALVEEMLVNSIEFLVVFYTNFPKAFSEAKQNS